MENPFCHFVKRLDQEICGIRLEYLCGFRRSSANVLRLDVHRESLSSMIILNLIDNAVSGGLGNT